MSSITNTIQEAPTLNVSDNTRYNMPLHLSSLTSCTATTPTTAAITPISVSQPISATTVKSGNSAESEDNNLQDNNNNNNNNNNTENDNIDKGKVLTRDQDKSKTIPVSELLPLITTNLEIQNIDHTIQNNNNNINTINTTNNNADNPIWEEDYKVKFCPKCNLKFTFFNRRHHCRKCGKIFCNKCSDNFCKFLPGSYIIESEEDGGKILVRNGFQNYKFRTCDDCYKEIKMLKEALGIKADSDSESESESGSGSESGSDNENLQNEYGVDRRITERFSNLDSIHNNDTEGEGDSTYLIKHSQPKVITLEINESTTTLDNKRKDNNISNENNDNNEGEENDELNECPVCSINLTGMNENKREEHINECLKNQEFGSPNNQGGLMKRDKNRMLVYNIPKDADMSQLTINEDNECVICLDEFHPGDKLGRLECLCCFHYKCIKDWIQKKGFCECPVHALHTE